jgi:hypothetical protein
MPELNRQLLTNTLAMVKEMAERGRWNQTVWAQVLVQGDSTPEGSCGTAFCFAGWAVQEAKAGAPLWVPRRFTGSSTVYDAIFITGGRRISKVAAEVLGLTKGDAGVLFNPSNTLADLEYLVGLLLEYGHLPEDWPLRLPSNLSSDLPYGTEEGYMNVDLESEED